MKKQHEQLGKHLRQYVDLFEQGKKLASIDVAPAPAWQPRPGEAWQRVVICAPHPDDEVLGGLFPLRLLQDDRRVEVVNLAMTLGSDPVRRRSRLDEMRRACSVLGFTWMLPAETGGFELTAAAEGDRQIWNAMVGRLTGCLAELKPALMVCPHGGDRHPTHMRSNRLVRQALLRYVDGNCGQRKPLLLETEFWHPMRDANLLLAAGTEQVAQQLAALLEHRGELQRNPYHCFLPAWLMDNVRRGGELVQGYGATATVPDFVFGVLGRLSRVAGGEIEAVDRSMMVGPKEPISLDLLQRLAG